jgi:hypothetical protein
MNNIYNQKYILLVFIINVCNIEQKILHKKYFQ